MTAANDASQWRLELAREISAVVRRYDGIRAMIVGGSVARGYADEYSDLEIPLIWETLPPDEVRLKIAAELGAEFLSPYSGPALEDNLLIHGFQVDFWQGTLANDEQVIDNVLINYSTDFGESNFMDTLRACIPLYGEKIIRRWKTRVQEYPEELAARNIQLALDAIETSHPKILAARGNLTLFYGQISALQKQAYLILLALNRQYFPSFKWMYRSLETMSIKPQAIESRFRRAFSAPPEEAIEDTASLLVETFALAQAQFPHIDYTAARSRIRLTRQAHFAAVHL